MQKQLISVFVFPTQMVKSFYFLNPKFQASSHFLLLYSPICVRPGWKSCKTAFFVTRVIQKLNKSLINNYIICFKQPATYLRIIWALLWENRLFAYAKTKTQISFAVTAKLISAFVFATRIVQSLFFLNAKFQASSHYLWLYSLVCVGPGRKPRRPVFSRGSWYFTNRIFICISVWFTRKKKNKAIEFSTITQTRPCNIQRYFTAVKMFIFRWKFLIFFLFWLKTLIVGTC